MLNHFQEILIINQLYPIINSKLLIHNESFLQRLVYYLYILILGISILTFNSFLGPPEDGWSVHSKRWEVSKLQHSVLQKSIIPLQPLVYPVLRNTALTGRLHLVTIHPEFQGLKAVFLSILQDTASYFIFNILKPIFC